MRELENPIVQRSIQLGVEVMVLAKNQKLDFAIKNQLLRSGTSVGANIMEAQNASSKRDFYNKMKIAAKELNEFKYWMIILERSNTIEIPNKITLLITENAKMLNSILSTVKSKI